MPYKTCADVCQVMTVRNDTKSNVSLSGFQFQFEASCVSSHSDEL